MKRDGDIASLFRRHDPKKAATTSNSSSVETVVEEHSQVQQCIIEEVANHMPPPPPPPPVYDISCLPHDPGERQPIQSYPVSDQDAIRIAYILSQFFQKGRLQIGTVHSILYGLITMTSLNIVSGMILFCFILSMLLIQKGLHLLLMDGETGILEISTCETFVFKCT
jgi:hypothetical protein